MEILHEPPSLDAFTPLTTHQSQTPSSFYEGLPVLHHHTHDAQLVISAHDLQSTPALSTLRASSFPPIPNGHTNSDADADADADSPQPPDIVLRNLSIYVTSERLIIFSPPTNHGLAIPYPSISLHAIQRLHLPPPPPQPSSDPSPPAPVPEPELQGLFMQISTSSGFDDHDLDATVSLTVVPAQQPPPTAPAPSPGAEVEEQGGTASTTTTTTTEIQTLFAAVTSCSNLHPDAVEQDDDEGGMLDAFGDGGGEVDVEGGATGLPPPMPGSRGWITAENVGEFFDGEGNWRGGVGGLGRGAGVVRGREEEEVEGDGEGVGGGEGGEGEETKWRRTG